MPTAKRKSFKKGDIVECFLRYRDVRAFSFVGEIAGKHGEEFLIKRRGYWGAYEIPKEDLEHISEERLIEMAIEILGKKNE